MSVSKSGPSTPVTWSPLFGDGSIDVLPLAGDTSASTAKAAAFTVGTQWPRWQISYAWASGSTKTATLLPYYQDYEGEWHSLGALVMKDVFASGDPESQLTDIIAPAGAKLVAFGLSDYTDGAVNVKVRGLS